MQAEVLETVGRYEIVGDLGAGSMSRVYLAHDPNLDRKVALKVVLQGFSLDSREQSELERRFLLEARAAGKLSHPGIVRVYDADTDPNLRIPYIAMEWVQGRSLRNLLEEGARLSGSRTLEILSQVARALDYAHRAGRIHRDIKPSNILISSDGTAKVSDFGVAKIVSETHTVSGQVLGTPAYMSPEQVKDDPLDGRSDLFSLGAVLYQCIAGTTPFGGESLVQVVYKILNVDPRPLQLPPTPALIQLAATVERSLQKDPNNRFQDGSEFALALDQIRVQLGSDPQNDFRAKSPRGLPKSPSDTVPNLAACTGRDPAKPTNTHAVHIDNTLRHPVRGSTGAHEMGRETDRPSSRAPRLSFIAALALALTALGVSAVFRLNQTPPAELTAHVPDMSPVKEESPPGPAASDQSIADMALLADDPSPEEVPAQDEIQNRQQKARDKTPKAVRIEPDRLPTIPDTTPSVTPQAEASLDASPPSDSSSVPRDDTPLPILEAPLESPPPPAVMLTPVTILYKHKGGSAFLSIRLDGVRVWSQDLERVAGRRQRWSGYETQAVVPVAPGTHTLEISLRDPDRGLEAVSSIRSRYTNGKKRTLRVIAEPKENRLRLRWKE